MYGIIFSWWWAVSCPKHVETYYKWNIYLLAASSWCSYLSLCIKLETEVDDWKFRLYFVNQKKSIEGSIIDSALYYSDWQKRSAVEWNKALVYAAFRLSPTVMEKTAVRTSGFIQVYTIQFGCTELVCAAGSGKATQRVQCGGSKTGGKNSAEWAGSWSSSLRNSERHL